MCCFTGLRENSPQTLYKFLRKREMTRILSRHRRQNRILAGFWPSPTPSAEHAPTPAHPRTPAHLLDINNPDCHLLGKKCYILQYVTVNLQYGIVKLQCVCNVSHCKFTVSLRFFTMVLQCCHCKRTVNYTVVLKWFYNATTVKLPPR